MIVLIVATASIYGQVEQNLCDVAPNADGLIFVNDPALCDGYLWCNVNATGTLLSVHQGQCPTDFFFSKVFVNSLSKKLNFKIYSDPVAFACDRQYTCVAKCLDSDVATVAQVRVAEAADLTCRNFKVCATGVLGDNVFSCNAPLVFNRALGICMDESSAPCTTSKQFLPQFQFKN